MDEGSNPIDVNRAQSPRSRYIEGKVRLAKDAAENGDHEPFMALIQEFIPSDVMDLAMTTLNMLRIPTQVIRPFGDTFRGCTLPGRMELTNAWNVAIYLADVIGEWDRLREFLELADKIRQLATAYCYVGAQADGFWAQQNNLWETGIDPTTGSGLTLARRCVAGVVRRVLMENMGQNPTGQPPTGAGGQPIDPDRFVRALRMDWEEERGERASLLLGLHRRGKIDVSDVEQTLSNWNQVWTPAHEFHMCVINARAMSISSRMGLSEQDMDQVFTGALNWSKIYMLGTQAYALSLPQEEEDYFDQKFLVRMASTRIRVLLFLRDLDPDDDNWADHWYQRFPACLPPLREQAQA